MQNIALNRSIQKSALFLTSTVQNVGRVASRQYFCKVCIHLDKPRKEIKSKHGNTNLMSHLLNKIHNPSQLTLLASNSSPPTSQSCLTFGNSGRPNIDSDEFIRTFRKCLILDAANGLVSFNCLASLELTQFVFKYFGYKIPVQRTIADNVF